MNYEGVDIRILVPSLSSQNVAPPRGQLEKSQTFYLLVTY